MSAARVSGGDFDAKNREFSEETMRRVICENYHVHNFSELTKEQQDEILTALGVPPEARGPDMQAGTPYGSR